MAELYKFEHVGKRFSGPENLEIFKDINLSVEEGESLAIVGPPAPARVPSCILWGLLILQAVEKSFLTAGTCPR